MTLTGVGGVGKTRLALQVAARLADEFPDGVWVFELAAVTDPASVPDAVAAVLGITQQPGKTVSESVLSTVLDLMGRYEPAATIAGFARQLPCTGAAFPELQHRDQPTCATVLGDQTYESLARTGRDDDHRRHGDVRLRPNRPGPNRTRTP